VGAVYLNVDLVLRARFDLHQLKSQLLDNGMDHISSRHLAGVWESRYELAGRHRHPSEAIDGILDIVERLGLEGTKLWNECISRRFDIGLQASDDPFTCTTQRWSHATWQITSPLLQRMCSVNASFVITVYRRNLTETT
jgi:hypothetical protein